MSGSITADAPPDAPPRRPALSPSRASDFRQCALLYRFRVVDRLPEVPRPAAVRGRVVHAVLEALFALPAAQRRTERLATLIAEVLDALPAAEAAVLGDGAAAEVEALAARCFTLEDPREVEPEGCEVVLEADLDGAEGADPTPLRGIVDRLDPLAGGGLRVVDYKSGSAPPEQRESRALFAMRFYALLLLRSRGVVPELRLMYLADAAVLTLRPGADELARFARVVDAVWAAIRRAAPTGDFRPRPGPGCAWCDHQALCPAFGGTPPPYPGWPPDADGTPEGRPGHIVRLPLPRVPRADETVEELGR